MARERTDADPTHSKTATPLFKRVSGNATLHAVIATCHIMFPAKIPSINEYKPITNIPIIAGIERLNNNFVGFSVSNCCFISVCMI